MVFVYTVQATWKEAFNIVYVDIVQASAWSFKIWCCVDIINIVEAIKYCGELILSPHSVMKTICLHKHSHRHLSIRINK